MFIIKARHGNGSVCARARAHSSVTALTSVTAARDVALTTRYSPASGQDEKIKNTARNRILLPPRSLSLSYLLGFTKILHVNERWSLLKQD